MRGEHARRYRRGDIVWWERPGGPGLWPTDGISKIRSIHRGVATMHDGTIVLTAEIRELIAAGDRPRTRRAALERPS